MGMEVGYYLTKEKNIKLYENDLSQDIYDEDFMIDMACDLGEMWNIIKYILTNQSNIDENLKSLYFNAIYGSQPINEECELIYNNIQQVTKIEKALSQVNFSELLNVLDKNELIDNDDIYPYIRNEDEFIEVKKYALKSFNDLQKLYQTAVKKQQVVIVEWAM